MRKLKELWNDFSKKYNKKDINFFGFVLAGICVFLAVIIPITITNNEVKAAQEAAAEAARIAFEEARQAAIEAEKKAEEERLAALSAALRQEQADAAAAKAEKEAAEKAAKEREELINSIDERIKATVSTSVQGMIDEQTNEDFSTQYSIQDRLLKTQEEATSSYEAYVGQLLSLYNEKFQYQAKDWEEEASNAFSSISNKINSIEESRVNREKELKAQQEEEAKKKYENHYLRFNRIDLTASSDSMTIQYLLKTEAPIAYGLKTGFLLDKDKDLLILGSLDFIFIDKYSFNFGFESSTGVIYRFSTKEFMPAFNCSGIFRYTIEDGFEFAFRPSILIETNFSDNVDIKLRPLTFGVSFTF